MLPVIARFCAADSFSATLPWNADTQGQFITSLCRDTHGSVWIGTEDLGVWCCQPSAPLGHQYTHFTQKDGLGDDNAYALVCDQAGRVWAGTLNHGVSVYNGKQWKTYGPIDGPLGSHIFTLAVSPLDGSVWGATEAGLFEYRAGKWTYFTRANGLPSDQANALAFSADGTLYVGSQCDGIAIASPANHYKTWRTVPGPVSLPNSAVGRGLPSALINCLLVSADNTVYAGTDGGLAWSRDEGETWTFTRGKDWKPKLAGLLNPMAPAPVPAFLVPANLLAEDYVTCLAEDALGRLWIGHRQQGIEVFDPQTPGHETLRWVQSGANGVKADDYVNCFLAEAKDAWVGLYGGGLLPPEIPKSQKVLRVSSVSYSPLPLPAVPPTVADLKTMLTQVQSTKTQTFPPGQALYLGEDWQTQGDWVGRYGNRYAVLCACGAPLNNYLLSDFSYEVSGFIGPHHNNSDGLRTWCLWVKTTDSRVLWDPIPGYRREAEWDDHGEAYPPSYEGPNIWAKVTVPTGLHQLSLYFVNANGHGGNERSRDYFLEIKPVPVGEPSTNMTVDPDHYSTVARARAQSFWPGVYKRFLVRGPGLFLVKVGRNNSFNTILPALMLDKISGPPTEWDWHRSVWYGKDTYKPPVVLKMKTASVSVAAAQKLWSAFERNADNAEVDQRLLNYRLFSYRAVLGESEKTGSNSKSQEIQSLLANWAWHLCFWDKSQHEVFMQAMIEAWQGLAEINPSLKLGNQ